MVGKITVYVDANEPKEIKQKAFFIAKEFGFDVDVKSLNSADFLCVNEKGKVSKIGVERKEASDFAESVMDGRLFVQALTMMENFDISVFAITGDMNKVNSKINRKALYSAVSSLIAKYRCSVVVYPNDDMLLYSIFKIFEHSQYDIDLSKLKKFNITMESREIGMLSCIEGISNKLAKRMLRKWTIREIAMIDDVKILMEVEGLGKKKAQNIIDVFSGGRKLDNYVSKINDLEKKIKDLNKKLKVKT